MAILEAVDFEIQYSILTSKLTYELEDVDRYKQDVVAGDLLEAAAEVGRHGCCDLTKFVNFLMRLWTSPRTTSTAAFERGRYASVTGVGFDSTDLI